MEEDIFAEDSPRGLTFSLEQRLPTGPQHTGTLFLQQWNSWLKAWLPRMQASLRLSQGLSTFQPVRVRTSELCKMCHALREQRPPFPRSSWLVPSQTIERRIYDLKTQGIIASIDRKQHLFQVEEKSVVIYVIHCQFWCCDTQPGSLMLWVRNNICTPVCLPFTAWPKWKLLLFWRAYLRLA